MFKYEDILAMMQNGQSAEFIAKSFTDALNKAISEDEAQKKAKQKYADAEVVYDTVYDFLSRYYANVVDIPEEKDVEGFIAALETGLPLLGEIQSVIAPINAHFSQSVNNNGKVEHTELTGEDAITEFLKMMGLA